MITTEWTCILFRADFNLPCYVFLIKMPSKRQRRTAVNRGSLSGSQISVKNHVITMLPQAYNLHSVFSPQPSINLSKSWKGQLDLISEKMKGQRDWFNTVNKALKGRTRMEIFVSCLDSWSFLPLFSAKDYFLESFWALKHKNIPL
jgi:hypothetical protein